MGSTKSNGKGFSMTSRHPDRSEEGRSPGPLRYKHEASMRTTGSPNPAAYSFGGRNTREGRNENPGPGSYSPEKPLGTFEFVSGRRNPIGTKLGLKHEHLVAKSGRNPGPGSYDPVSTDLFKQKAPAYSVTPKTYTWYPCEATLMQGNATELRIRLRHKDSITALSIHSLSIYYSQTNTLVNTY